MKKNKLDFKSKINKGIKNITKNSITDLNNYLYWMMRNRDFKKSYFINPNKNTLINIISSQKEMMNNKKIDKIDDFDLLILEELLKYKYGV
ncbi:MAG: hypothetical protein ABEK36_05260 [Candidatus Aenigmatarchaeota archaeon]